MAILMRRCLIVSPHFPPSTLAGVHRARHLAKHLPVYGWLPTIITVDPKHHIERMDPELASLVPASVDIVRTGALSARLTGLVGIKGELGLRSYFHLKRAIRDACNRLNPDIIMITGSPFYPMLLAEWIQNILNRPVLIDFQDPWVSREGATRPALSKNGISHRLALFLEPRAVRSASFITSVSEGQNEEMRSRYPWLSPTSMAAIPIGGDPEDFRRVRVSTLAPASGKKLQFSYVGTALPRATPILRALFKSIAALRDEKPELANQCVFRFVGTSNQPNETRRMSVIHLAKEAGVGDLVVEEPARIPFMSALTILRESHAILMVGSVEPHYTASKIYPGLMSGKPFISIFHRASSAHDILSRTGGGFAITFDEQGLDIIVPTIANSIERLITDPESIGRVDPRIYSDYTADAVARKFAELFDQATRLR